LINHTEQKLCKKNTNTSPGDDFDEGLDYVNKYNFLKIPNSRTNDFQDDERALNYTKTIQSFNANGMQPAAYILSLANTYKYGSAAGAITGYSITGYSITGYSIAGVGGVIDLKLGESVENLSRICRESVENLKKGIQTKPITDKTTEEKFAEQDL
jgi:hypothetical protein